MRHPLARWLFLVVLSVTLALGCRGRDSPSAAGGNLAGRLAAAKGMQNVFEKDKALAQVARDAADAGDAAIADQALAAMQQVLEKDKAACSAALRLAKVGKAEAAAATAKVIREIDLKDKTLAKIARGDTSE